MNGQFVYERHSHPPHLRVSIAGTITLDEIKGHVTPFEQMLDRMPPGFVFLSHQLALTSIERDALGVMFYLVRRIYEARPRAVLIINGGQFVHSQLEKLIERLDPGGVLHVLDSEAEAAPWLRASASFLVL